jgi:hypothetical protein
MDTSPEHTELLRRALAALRQQFFFIDVTASDLSRLCRYYGTWNRKSNENLVERPWRKSEVLDECERTPVAISQLQALCQLMGVPTSRMSSDDTPPPGAQEKFVRRFVAYCERISVPVIAVRKLGDGTIFLQTDFCLLNEDHTGSSCGVGVGPDGVRKNLCKHNGCAMPWARWARLVEEKYGEIMRLDGEIRWK